MVALGYALSSEEHDPRKLVRFAQMAEESGFDFTVISDHFHPWTSHQGSSPFAWTVLGGIAATTERITVGTAVTCPIMRYHPAIIAQAAATAATMMPGRFFLGLGSGELLNEHVVGQHWPPPAVRLSMLREAIEVIRDLWSGDEIDHHGEYFDVEQARIFTLPAQPPPIVVASTGDTSARLAGENDGLMLTAPLTKVIETFERSGGAGKPRYGQLSMSLAKDDATARRNAFEWWPTAAVNGPLNTEIATPGIYDSLVKLVSEEDVTATMPCSSDAGPFLKAIDEYAKKGVTHLALHPIGPDQETFFEFFRTALRPALAQAA